MGNLLSKLSSASGKKPIEPREIFMTLPQKSRQYEYPRDVQTEVWKKWFDRRNETNSIIKMNTGSGKTVVGLMILQSCMNEGKGPAIYVVPDNYLVEQVCEEAAKLGIRTTTKRDDYHYSECNSILVMPIHTLVNGRSVFGMRSYNNYPIGSILLDDVHACLDTITEKYSLRIPAKHELYSEMIALFADAWKQYDPHSYTNIVDCQNTQKRTLLPFWIWQEKSSEVYRLLEKYDNDEEQNQLVYFNLPLFSDRLPLCHCVITASCIEITPFGTDISKIKSFQSASRRIFMSATLSDDSVFVTALGLKPESISSIITPESANDIGDRLILFPKHLNHSLTDEIIREKITQLAGQYNVVVIVPSGERAKFWDPTGSRTVTRENIKVAVATMKERLVGLCVFVNRYDGIDLPGDACRMLVLDGLPPLHTEYEKYVQSIDASSSILLREQVQRIEQGMGRGVRSNSDSCCVVLMGDQLSDVLLRNQGVSYFSKATMVQFGLSKELWALLKDEHDTPTVDQIFELADYSFHREAEWVKTSKERLSDETYSAEPRFDDIALALRKAYEHALDGELRKSTDELSLAIIKEQNDEAKGYLHQIKAEYINLIDHAQAQQVLLTGRKMNKGILIPIDGIQYDKAINEKEQAKAICDHLESSFHIQNDYLLYVESVLEGLRFSTDPDSVDLFERSMMRLGQILGFVASRPEKEIGAQGPDGLWAIGKGKYLIIECKSAAATESISKNDCNQLGGAVRWFAQEYGPGFSCTPIMVHPSTLIHQLASPVDGMRVIDRQRLDKLKEQTKAFSIALVQSENWRNESSIVGLLQLYHLRSQDIVESYSCSYQSRRM